MARIEVISGIERRRRWSKEAKLKILAEADEPGVRLADVARRYDIYPAQMRSWRQTLRGVGVPATFLPVEIIHEAMPVHATGRMDARSTDLAPPCLTPRQPVIIEIVFGNGRCLKVPSDLELNRLASLITCVEAV